ncbi:MAG: hypothetical protein Kow00108_16920 [Calditrichia bacterium]
MRYIYKIILILLNLIPLLYAQNVHTRYYEMDFKEFINELKRTPFNEMTPEQQRLWIESHARVGDGHSIFTTFQKWFSNHPVADQKFTTAGILFASLGQFQIADEFLSTAVRINERNYDAFLARTSLLMYLRQFNEAEASFLKAEQICQDIKHTGLYRNIGYELYNALFEVNKKIAFLEKIRKVYQTNKKSEKIHKTEERIRLFMNFKNQRLFKTVVSSVRIEVPMIDFAPGVFYKCLVLRMNGKEYKILLDTGNAVGWTIHDSNLLELLNTQIGTKSEIATGSVEKTLKSAEIITPSLKFDQFSVRNLSGYYFRKPRENYFDANLNPIFIRDYVVTMDFIHNKFILRTKQQFEKDLEKDKEYICTKLPFYGYEWPFIPVQINGYANALAMIETGAEDVILRKEFAEWIHLPLLSRIKKWGEKEYLYNETKHSTIRFGIFQLTREKMEVWPKRFYDHVTGLYYHVMIGPIALEGKYIVSFDPFDNVIIFQKPVKKISATYN